MPQPGCEDVAALLTDLGAHLMQRCGDGFGRCVAAKHVTLQHTAVLIPRHKGKVPEHSPHTHTHIW